MTPYHIDVAAWQESWDRQQEAFMPDREHRIAMMLDAVEAITDRPDIRVLDLAGGTGSIGLRTLTRFPQAQLTLVDLDPVLLAIAEASLTGRATVTTADLNDPGWTASLPLDEYDAVLTATALHWFDRDRLATLYREIQGLLRPGGILVNADHMPDPGLPDLSTRLLDRARARRSARYATGAALSWSAWWEQAATDPVLAPLVEKRRQIYPTGHSPEWNPTVDWHLDALHAAAFAEVGLLWRGGTDAAVVGVR